MKGLPRDGLHVHLLQVSTEDLVQRLNTLVRGIVRSREPSDRAVGVSGAARSTHGQTPASYAQFCARAAQAYPSLSVDWGERFNVSGDFFHQSRSGASRVRRALAPAARNRSLKWFSSSKAYADAGGGAFLRINENP